MIIMEKHDKKHRLRPSVGRDEPVRSKVGNMAFIKHCNFVTEFARDKATFGFEFKVYVSQGPDVSLLQRT